MSFPLIIGLVGAYHSANHVYMLTEYIHGRDMFSVMREVKIITKEIAQFFIACLLLSLEYMHREHYIHRDLKPENAIVDSHGRVHLIDMGTAKQLSEDQFFKTFTIVGRPHYMAPEIFEGYGYSFEADIWSLGCILYELLCYSPPWRNPTDDPF